MFHDDSQSVPFHNHHKSHISTNLTYSVTMKLINSAIYALVIMCLLFGHSNQLSISNPTVVTHSKVINSVNLSVNSLFNITYNSRLFYQLREQVNSLQFNTHSKISSSCKTVLQTLLNDPNANRWSLSSKILTIVNSNSTFALKVSIGNYYLELTYYIVVLDANAPIPSSLLWDQLTSVGGYDQCLDIKGFHHEIAFHGQYCLLDLRVRQQFQLKTGSENEMQNFLAHVQNVTRRFPLMLGLCIPSICSAQEINHLLDSCKIKCIIYL